MLLEIRELSKRYMRNGAPFFAVDHADLNLQPGDFVCITGRSGSGKSTLLNLTAGLIHPDKGRIVLDGNDYSGLNDKALSALRRERIGYIPQGTGILYSLSILDNIRLPMALGAGRSGGRQRAGTPREADVVRDRHGAFGGDQQARDRRSALDPRIRECKLREQAFCHGQRQAAGKGGLTV